MSFRPGLLPSLLRPRGVPQLTPKRAYHPRFQRFQTHSRVVDLARPAPAPKRSVAPLLFPLGLGLSYLTYTTFSSPIRCEAAFRPPASPARPVPEVGGGNPEIHSSLDAFQLSFGGLAGICTGVFVKKGLRGIAFVLGGIFVLLQYLSSKKFVSVDWGKVSKSYEGRFGSTTSTGEVRAPTIGGVWAWFVDFVTANFQQRATFLAGLALGFRLG